VVDLAALVQEAAMPLAGNPRVNLVKELAPVSLIPGDPDALLRVLQNLVSNAVEANGGDGTVTLRTFEQAGHAVVAVADTGHGMSEEFMRTSLFAPFRSTKTGGWGIGLYQAKTLVEAHGGVIEVTSKEGAGTTFSVRLPLARRGGET
jgi:signal transduction histidine kinase